MAGPRWYGSQAAVAAALAGARSVHSVADPHLASALQQALQARNHSHEVLDPQASMDGRVGQVLRLSTAVGQSIFAFEYGALRLPSKGNAFDWTVGDGAATLASRHGADYALFVGGRGAFASAGRKALMVGAALLGYGIPLGSQQVYLSLVELRTGRVLWFNVATAGNGTDIRDAEGARGIVDTLLTSAPL